MTDLPLENKSIYNSNMELLKDWDPGLSNRICSFEGSSDLDVLTSRTGQPVPVAEGRSLHSSYDPEKEARRLVDSWNVNGAGKQVVFGLGFGYHVNEYLKRHQGSLAIVEPDMGLFKAFLSHIPLGSNWERVRFFVKEPPPRLLSRNGDLDWTGFSHPPSIQHSQKYFQQLENGRELIKLFKNNKLRVLVVPPIYGGSLPTARFCEQALKGLGHTTSMVNCDSFADSFNAINEVTSNEQNTEVLSRQFMGLMDEVIVAKAVEFQPDLVLGLAQAPLGKSSVNRLKQLGAPLAFWFVEDFRTLTYWKETAPWYDHFFTIQQKPFFNELSKLGINHAYYLPQACSPETQRPVELSDEEINEYEADVSFMGAAYYNRLQTFPRLLDLDFKIWGTGWDAGSVFGPYIQKNGERVSSEECVKIFNGCKINLNLHSSTFHEGVHPEGDFVNPRTFEIAACGAFQLVDDRTELSPLFKEGEEMVTFSDIEDLKQKIKFYCEHPVERTRIAEQSRTRILKEHTFEHRMLELLLVVFDARRDFLENRLQDRVSPVSILKEQAGEDSELGQYLNQFTNEPDFSLATITDHIKEGEGKLSKNELLFLMLDQVVK